MELPPAFAAREIVTWCVRQVELQEGALALGDLLFHSARKIHMMGDFELVDARALDSYLKALGPLLLEACPPEGREHLALGLSRLDESRQALASKVEIVHRQSGAAEPVGRAAAASAQQAAEAAPRVLSALVQGLGRLPLLLQRLEQFALPPPGAPTPGVPSVAPGAAGTAPPPVAAGRAALVADAVLEASLQAKDGAELEQYLESIRRLGVVAGTDEMFRALGRSVSGWTLPAVPDVPALPEGVQVSAMRRMIALADGPAEAGRRFREMVHAAIEQFNEGSYGRSLKMFDLARQMAGEGQVQALFIEPMIVSGHEYLAEERIRKLAERPEGHFFLRPVLGFFRAFAPDHLLDELQAESRRDRRRQILNLLEAQGAPARAAAWERLQSDREGSVGGLYFVRNLVHLLRAVPRPADAPWPHEEEIDAVAGARGDRAAAVPGQGSPPVPGGEPPPRGPRGTSWPSSARSRQRSWSRARQPGNAPSCSSTWTGWRRRSRASRPRARGPPSSSTRSSERRRSVTRSRASPSSPARTSPRRPRSSPGSWRPSRRTCPTACSAGSCRVARPS